MKKRTFILLVGLALSTLVLGGGQVQAQSSARGSGSTYYPAPPSGANKVPQLGQGEEEKLAKGFDTWCKTIRSWFKPSPSAPTESKKDCTGKASECGAQNPSSSGSAADNTLEQCMDDTRRFLDGLEESTKKRQALIDEKTPKGEPRRPWVP